MARYEFDDDFQTKIAALSIRDATFNLRTDGLVEPSYLSNEAEATLVGLVKNYWAKYRTIPTTTILVALIKKAVASKAIRSDMVDEVKDAVKRLLKEDVSDRDFVIDEVAEFARHQAIIAAMEKSIDALDRRDFDSIEAAMQKAMQVGVNEANEGHDYWEEIEARSQRRRDVVAGVSVPTITTGVPELDDALNGGFGRGELAVLMGPAKRGKSFLLMNFAVNASRATPRDRDHYNVLMITLENSVDITTNRMDGYVSQHETNKINDAIKAVEAEIIKNKPKGVLKIHEFPTGTFAPRDLRRLLENYRAKGIVFDEIVVDYWDIMAPDVHYKDDKISESASIGIGLRAIAKQENAAVVTAIQSNRDGFKAHVAGPEHAAEDFNKVRLADVFFSVNADEDERAMGEARLHMGALRNNASGFVINIKQDLARGAGIAKVMGRASV